MENKIILPAEWYPQSAVQLTWPHDETDWAPILDEVIPCFVSIAKEVIKHEKLLIVCPDEQEVRRQLGDVDDSRIIFREMATNDTWARDHGGITVFDQGEPVVYDFVFNGWGMKFAANLDNLVTRTCRYREHLPAGFRSSICNRLSWKAAVSNRMAREHC